MHRTAKEMIENLVRKAMVAEHIPESDEVLLSQIAAGEADALQALYHRYGKRMYAYSLRLVNHPQTAEDVLQESMLAVWQNASKYRHQGRVIAWLLAIVHNKAMRTFRRKPSLDLENFERYLPDPAPLPDEKASQSEHKDLLRDGLHHLSVEHRTILELVFYQGLSLKETAQVLGCPLGTVKSRLSYAKENLKGVLNREGLTAEDV